LKPTRCHLPVRAIILAGLLLPAAGCADSVLSTTQSVDPVERTPEGFATWTDAVPPYEFEAGDKIKVQFLLTPEMSEDTVVAPDGTISLRAAGQLDAAGQTVKDLQAAVAKAATKTLINPDVTVSLIESPGSPVYVGGAVTKPGAYTMTGRRGSFEAIQLAGGFSPEARMTEVVLVRRNAQNRPMLRTVDLRALLQGSDVHPDVPLLAGDIVFVPRNKISEIDLWIDQYINKFIPFSRSFIYAVNHNASSVSGL
jgi:protein involved in polysaccharide export with SLBB domain